MFSSPFCAAEMSEAEKAKRAKLAAKAGGATNSEIAAAFAAKSATKRGKTKAKSKDDGQAKPAFTKSAQVGLFLLVPLHTLVCLLHGLIKGQGARKGGFFIVIPADLARFFAGP